MQITDSFKNIFNNKSKIMVIMAHPDDAEIYSGGTINRLITEGKKVRVVKMTSGNKGSRQNHTTDKKLAEIRLKEDRGALGILGVRPEDNINLNLPDGEVENSLDAIGLLVYQIRAFKPDIIITHNPEGIIIKTEAGRLMVNHRDHRYTGISSLDAVYPYSRDRLFFPEHLKEGICTHKVVEVLFTDPDNNEEIYIDISNYWEAKSRAVAFHQSQFDPKEALEVSSMFTKKAGTNFYESFKHVVIR